MKIVKLFMEGGPIKMSVVTFFGLLMLFFLFQKVMMIRKKKYDSINLTYILMFGGLAFLTAILAQAIDLCLVMGLIQEVGDISLTLFAKGFQLSLFAPIYGLVIFIISLTAWGIFREINIRGMQKG